MNIRIFVLITVRWIALQEGLIYLSSYLSHSTHCKYDFIPFTSPQWVSTWKVRTGHITLSDVPSKTEHRILYGSYITRQTPEILDTLKNIFTKLAHWARWTRTNDQSETDIRALLYIHMRPCKISYTYYCHLRSILEYH